MNTSRKIRRMGRQLEKAVGLVSQEAHANDSSVLRTLGWVSAGVTVVALGVVVGRELRSRYRFTRRTPYDAYSHSGDRQNDMEFGLGI